MQSNTPPLAERMRPQDLGEVIGQAHLVGPNGILTRILAHGSAPSMILWGPPGVGKTTLAYLLARKLQRPFHVLSAISAGVKEVREVIEKARGTYGTILFIDEIHRFNKAQQDALLGAVERGILTLIGATTENPSFEVNAALLSRCQVYTLRALEREELLALLEQAMQKDAWLQKHPVRLEETEALLNLSGGDARRLLNLFQLVAETAWNRPVADGQERPPITDALVVEVAQQRTVLYDKSGEQHYDIVSAFIKSIRGSDPNAALYWMARMIEGGEEVRFIARRLVILASEDIGNANPTAIVMATNCFQAVEMVGYPEAEIILAQTVTYLASSPKSNASYVALHKARQLVREKGDLPVPMHLRNAPTRMMKNMGYGKGYQYAHDYQGNFVSQEFMPDELAGTRLYDPGKSVREDEIRKWLQVRWKEKYGY